ncbi:MAG: InlB B-repeat-containing protein, partial [Lachnospiraceae bacterium]|nr:InlB B-repeat-containing protein [Lachnospiraceae bacterium]
MFILGLPSKENGLVTTPNSANYQRAGYTFLGWFKGEETTAYKFNTPVTADFTLTATWSTITYTITYV